MASANGKEALSQSGALAPKKSNHMQTPKGNILIVDDNKSILSTLEILLSPVFQTVTALSNPNQISAELSRKDYSLVILDMNFKAGVNTGNEGIFWLNRIKETNPEISVVMITAYGDIDTAVRALKAGASDFILKPWDNEKLLATLKLAIQLNLSKMEVKDLKEREKELKKEINRGQRYHYRIVTSDYECAEPCQESRKDRC